MLLGRVLAQSLSDSTVKTAEVDTYRANLKMTLITLSDVKDPTLGLTFGICVLFKQYLKPAWMPRPV